MQNASLTEKRINPLEVKSRYLWILSSLADSLSGESKKPLRFSEMKRHNGISDPQLYKALAKLEEGGYLKKIEVNRRPYYILWKWGILTLEAESLNAIGLLEMMYSMEVG